MEGVSGTVLHLDFLWWALLPDGLGPKVLMGPLGTQGHQNRGILGGWVPF